MVNDRNTGKHVFNQECEYSTQDIISFSYLEESEFLTCSFIRSNTAIGTDRSISLEGLICF